MTLQPALFSAPVAGLVPVHKDFANELCVAWQHKLGPCRRLFGVEGWTLDVHGVPVAVAISASTVSKHVVAPDRIFLRTEVVELARLCADPANRWATRPLLRLWREVAAPAWSHWPVHAAVSYSLNRHTGDLYRFDGWELWGERKGSTGGGTWSPKRENTHVAAGKKLLWGWRYQP